MAAPHAKAPSLGAVIPPGWEDALGAEKLTGHTLKYLQRLMREGRIRIEMGHAAVAGRKPITIYKRADLEAAVSGLRGIRPPNAAVATRSGQQPSVAAALIQIAEQLQALMRPALNPPPPEPDRIGSAPTGAVPVPIQRKIFLTLAEARAYTGLPRNFLERMKRETPACGLRLGRRFFFRRAYLAQL